MRRAGAGLAGLLVLAAVQVGLAPPGDAVDRDQLIGTWTSTDTDGSSQWLAIRGGGSDTYAMTLYDEVASSACGGAPARVAGTGRTDGDELTMSGTLTCAPGGNVFRTRLSLAFTYDVATGTLTDFSGVVWHRS